MLFATRSVYKTRIYFTFLYEKTVTGNKTAYVTHIRQSIHVSVKLYNTRNRYFIKNRFNKIDTLDKIMLRVTAQRDGCAITHYRLVAFCNTKVKSGVIFVTKNV